MDTFLHLIQSPEFWLSFAFCAVILIAFNPLKKYLMGWGTTQANKIKQRLDEPASLRTQAEALYAQYEGHTKNQMQERSAILQNAQEEIDNLRVEFEQRTKERLERKDRDVSNRLQIVQENGIKQMQDQMTKLVIKKTYEILQEQNKTENMKLEMDKAIHLLCDSLKTNAHLLKD